MGISGKRKMYSEPVMYKKTDFIINEEPYNIEESLSYIAKELDHSQLIIASCPEKYNSDFKYICHLLKLK